MAPAEHHWFMKGFLIIHELILDRDSYERASPESLDYAAYWRVIRRLCNDTLLTMDGTARMEPLSVWDMLCMVSDQDLEKGSPHSRVRDGIMEYFLAGLLITCVRIVHPVLVTHLARETSTALFRRHAFARSENPNGIPSQSPGLRGTSYPGSSSVKPSQPRRCVGVVANPFPPAGMTSAATPLALFPFPNAHPR
jgi:hypothetical protein